MGKFPTNDATALCRHPQGVAALPAVNIHELINEPRRLQRCHVHPTCRRVKRFAKGHDLVVVFVFPLSVGASLPRKTLRPAARAPLPMVGLCVERPHRDQNRQRWARAERHPTPPPRTTTPDQGAPLPPSQRPPLRARRRPRSQAQIEVADSLSTNGFFVHFT